MKNRIASLLLVFALLLSLCGNAVARDNRIVIQSGGAERFTDVPTSHWAYSYINKVVGSGLFNGMTPTTFAPSNAMTRAQFVIVMSRMEGLEVERVETVTKFPDVPSNYWAAGAVAWATEAGIVGGFGDGTFKPTSPITRGQFAALIHRYIVSKRYVNLHVVDPEPAQFTDAASVSSAFTNDVEYARVHGLLTGYSDGTVRASNPITRAAIAAILARFLDLVQESGYTPLLDGPVIDGGDSGDSGTTPVDTPTNYDAIKMSVLAGTHGTTAIASVLRNGQQVASDDVQAGDRVTITHKPESGYVASVRVRDANGKVVTVHKTDANTSWFEMPAAMPVTVTVTYSKESSGGGGGGGGSGSTPSSSVTQNYFLNVTSNVTGNGTVQFIRRDVSSLESLEGQDLEDSLKSWYQDTTTFTFSVVLKPATSLKGDPSVTNATKVYEQPTTFGDSVVYVYRATNTTPDSQTSTNALNVVVTANFSGGTTPANKWKLTASVTGGYVAIFDKVEDATEDAVNKNAEASVISDEYDTSTNLYVAFTRNSDYEGNPDILPASLQLHKNSVDNKLWIYEVSSDVTSVEATFTPSTPLAPGANNPITVVAQLADGSTPDELPTPKALKENAEVTVATIGDTVTINAPEIAGYASGYYVTKVTGETANGAPITLTPSKPATSVPANNTADANGETFTFKMPGSAVTITVEYALNPDEDLSYKVNVNFSGDGKGSMTLNVAGTDYPLSNAEEGGTTTVDLTKDDNVPKTKSQYISLYGVPDDNGDWSLPIYASAPVPSADSKLTTYTTQNPNLGSSSKEAPAELLPDTDATVNVTFDQLKAYGYKLTVIGKGSVTGNFDTDNISLSNDTNQPKTTASGSIIKDDAPDLKITAEPETGWALDSIEVITPSDKEKGTSTSQEEAEYSVDPMEAGITEIIVSFYDEKAGAVTFQVTGDPANVTVKAENGTIQEGSAPDDPTPEQLKSGKKTVSPTDTKNTYYARVGTILTIQAKSGKVLTLVQIDGKGGVDELATAGFSYTLPEKNGVIVINVETGTKDSYSVAFQLPYIDGVASIKSSDIHTKTIGITSEKLNEILYSLNDGYQKGETTNAIDGLANSRYWSSWDNTKTGIQNNYGLSGNRLTEVISYYLKSTTNSENKTGAQALEATLNDIVKEQVKSNLNNIITEQKDDMLDTQRESLNAAIQSELDSKLVFSGDQPSVEIRDKASKASVVQAALAYLKENDPANAIDDKELENYTVTATVEPILNDNQLNVLSAEKRAQVSTVKSQLNAFIQKYLKNELRISEVDTDNAEASASVEVIDENKCTVRISVTAALADRPVVVSSFADLYANRLTIWLLSTLKVYHNDTEITGLPNSITKDVFSMSSVKFDDPSKSTSMTNDITTKLGAVDDAINNKLNTQLADYISATTNSSDKYDVYVDMKTVLDKSMIDKVVEGTENNPNDEEGVLEKIANTISNKVESAKPAENTKKALMNVYRQLVDFNKGEDDLLTLKTQKGNSAVLGRVVDNADGKGNSLVLYLDFDRILADKGQDNDTAYERLIDLVMAVRDGFATDIRVNENANGQTAESVISGLIMNQLDRFHLSANKWGTKIGDGGRDLNPMEKQELCDLAAKLIMTPLDTSIETAWADFEQQGYQSISVVLNVNVLTRGDALKQLAQSLHEKLGASASEINAGIKVEEVFK